MAEQTSEETIPQLLKELQSTDAYRRKSAAESLAALQTSNDQIANALRSAAANDPNRFVKQAAQEALIALGLEAPMVSKPSPSPASKKELSRNEKIRDFSIGFVGWWAINGIIWAGVVQPRTKSWDLPAWLAQMIGFGLLG